MSIGEMPTPAGGPVGRKAKERSRTDGARESDRVALGRTGGDAQRRDEHGGGDGGPVYALAHAASRLSRHLARRARP
jgi:hypothetical protein